MAKLRVLKGKESGKSIELSESRSVIGRHPGCAVVVDEGAVSRQHAQIVREGDAFFLEDLKSRNGTFLNGKRIAERTRLLGNDRIKICDVLFTFELPPEQAAARELESAASFVVAEDSGDGGPLSSITSAVDVTTSFDLQVRVKPEAKLRAVLEISQNLSNTLDLEQVLPKILESLFKIFPQADRGFIILEDPETERLVPKAIRHRHDQQNDSLTISRTIVNHVMSDGKAILSADAASDSRFDNSQSITDFRIRSMMCAPLTAQTGKSLGIIYIDTEDAHSHFQQEDLDVLASAATQAARAVENAKLHQELADRERLRRELAFAAEVQRGFLPVSRPGVARYQFYDFYEAARMIGGDYFDYIPLPGDRLAVALGDVAGKGVAAALLMARLSAEVRFCLATVPDPAEAVNRLNLSLAASGMEDRFVTFVLAVLDLKDDAMTLVNAGHMEPLLRRSGSEEITLLGGQEAGLPLGVAPEMPMKATQSQLEVGDVIVLYTDGVSEAMSPDDKLYGLDRLQQTLLRGPAEVEALGDAILADVQRFASGRAQHDDLTLVCFGRRT